MSAKEPIFYFNGKYLPRSKVKIDVFDDVVEASYMVFDATVARNGYVFKLDRCIDRLWRSMQAAMMDIQMIKSQLKDIILETVRRNGFRNATIQVIVTGGVHVWGEKAGEERPTVIVIVWPYLSVATTEQIERGLKARISSIQAIPHQTLDPKIKCGMRLHWIIALKQAQAAGADKVILMDMDGYVTDEYSSNIFIVKDGKLYTSEEEVLMGHTRETVLEIALREGIAASERRLTPYDLYNADEAFFTSTGGGILPFVEVDGRIIGDGRPGSLTKRLRQLYFEMLERGEHGVRF